MTAIDDYISGVDSEVRRTHPGYWRGGAGDEVARAKRLLDEFLALTGGYMPKAIKDALGGSFVVGTGKS